MKLDLDTEHLKTCLRLWRDAVDLKSPMQDEVKLHYMKQRPVILKNHERTAAAWLMALRTAMPIAEDQDAFDGLITEIEEFQNWAAAGLQTLDRMVLQAEVETGLDTLLANDTQLSARLADLTRTFRKGNPDAGA